MRSPRKRGQFDCLMAIDQLFVSFHHICVLTGKGGGRGGEGHPNNVVPCMAGVGTGKIKFGHNSTILLPLQKSEQQHDGQITDPLISKLTIVSSQGINEYTVSN